MENAYTQALSKVFDVTSASLSDAYGATAAAEQYIKKQSPEIQKVLREAAGLCIEHYNLTWAAKSLGQPTSAEVWEAYGEKCREAARLIAAEPRVHPVFQQILGGIR